jgi:hypothetical protein
MPVYTDHGSASEARLLLELCHHLCQRIGLDAAVRGKLLRIVKKAGPPCTCTSGMEFHLWLQSPLSDEPLPIEQPRTGNLMEKHLSSISKKTNPSAEAGEDVAAGFVRVPDALAHEMCRRSGLFT